MSKCHEANPQNTIKPSELSHIHLLYSDCLLTIHENSLGAGGGRGNSHVHKTSQPFQTNDCAEIGSVRRSEKTQKKSTNQTMIACVENIQQ